MFIVERPWMRAFSRERNITAWRRIGIFPFNQRVLHEVREREARGAAAKERAQNVMRGVDLRRLLGEGGANDLGVGVAAVEVGAVVEQVGAGLGELEDVEEGVEEEQEDVEVRLCTDSEGEEEEEEEAGAALEERVDDGQILAQLPDQELQYASDTSEDVDELDPEFVEKARSIKLNSSNFWAKPLTSKGLMALLWAKEQGIEEKKQKRIDNAAKKEDQDAEKRRNAFMCVKELEKMVVDAQGEWKISTRSGCIHKIHVTFVYTAFGKQFPGPENTWRDWLDNLKLVVGWSAADNKFLNL